MTQFSHTSDATGARAAILAAAEEIFAKNGFSGARVDAIAAAAGYNKSLIYQYFGNKLALYEKILAEADREAGELRARILAPLLTDAALATDAEELRSFLRMALTAVFDHLLARPRLLRILIWEMAEGWQTYAKISTTMQLQQSDRLDALFQKAQQAGLIRSTFSPAVQLTLALQICQTYLASRPLYDSVLPPESTFATSEQARQFVVEFILSGMLGS